MEIKLNNDKTLLYIGENEATKEAYLSFTISKNIITIRHIFTDPKFRGQGIAGKLIVELTNFAENNNLKITSMCGYCSSWLAKHEEYSHLLA